MYYYALRSILKAKPHLRPCLTRCRHCRIYFFTHPRNAGRKDLGCPFGCKDTHRKKRSTERSKAYYSTLAGKWKKKLQNDKRCEPGPKPDSAKEPEERSASPEVDDIEFDAGMVEHVRVVTSLIEGWRVSRDEVLQMLRRTVRQHSMSREKRIDYIVRFMEEKPP